MFVFRVTKDTKMLCNDFSSAAVKNEIAFSSTQYYIFSRSTIPRNFIDPLYENIRTSLWLHMYIWYVYRIFDRDYEVGEVSIYLLYLEQFVFAYQYYVKCSSTRQFAAD